MPNKNYIRGRKFEWELMETLQNRGADMVFRTAGSHGKYDVIAFFFEEKEVELYQCKTKKSKKSKPQQVSETMEFGGFWKVRACKITKFYLPKKRKQL